MKENTARVAAQYAMQKESRSILNIRMFLLEFRNAPKNRILENFTICG